MPNIESTITEPIPVTVTNPTAITAPNPLPVTIPDGEPLPVLLTIAAPHPQPITEGNPIPVKIPGVQVGGDRLNVDLVGVHTRDAIQVHLPQVTREKSDGHGNALQVELRAGDDDNAPLQVVDNRLIVQTAIGGKGDQIFKNSPLAPPAAPKPPAPAPPAQLTLILSNGQTLNGTITGYHGLWIELQLAAPPPAPAFIVPAGQRLYINTMQIQAVIRHPFDIV